MSVNAGRAYPATLQLYNESVAGLPGAKGSGIVAAKSGYHSSRAYNLAKHKGNYSIVLAEDLQGPSDAAAAIDITPKDSAQQRLLTERLKAAVLARDPRVAAVKEFYGSLNTTNGRNGTVYGLGKKSSTGVPYETSSDSSHLWHVHISIFRKFVDDWDALKGIVEVLTGKASQTAPKPSTPSTPKPSTPKPAAPAADWTKKLIMALPTVKRGSKGAAVKREQALLVAAGRKLSIDGDFGPATDRETRAFQRARGLAADGICGPKTWTKLLGQ